MKNVLLIVSVLLFFSTQTVCQSNRMQKMIATTDISSNYDQMVHLELYKINKRIKRLEKVTKTKFQLILIEHDNDCRDIYDRMTIVKNKCIKTKHK